MNSERERLRDADAGKVLWRTWGPYLSERQWGTVREDYSPDGSAWDYLPHDHARSRAYRWGEDGIAGLSDDEQRLCFSLALWNGRDHILKERLFGVTGPEGNHGEDVKELYWYLDATPTSSYLKMLYKYPQSAYPYARLVDENRRRGKGDPEFELIDTGIFDEDRYFDVFVEAAKNSPEDLLVRITAHNRGSDEAVLHILPQAWFRNTWSWGRWPERPRLARKSTGVLLAEHGRLGRFFIYHDRNPNLLFCDNETNVRRLSGTESNGFFKDAFHDYVVDNQKSAVNPAQTGTKAAAHHVASIPAGSSTAVQWRMSRNELAGPFDDFDAVFSKRTAEADAFYDDLQRGMIDPDDRMIHRQALAGMLWNRQVYYFDVPQWLEGDPAQPPPPTARREGRNRGWEHLNNFDIISMPDKWEYPWYAAWDLAFHCVAMARLDPAFAKDQLVLMTREWYMHPSGQLPAYEWEFGDVNPPLHAWAAWRVFQIDRESRGDRGDVEFLERVFHKMLINFTWWVNRKDLDGHNIFQGGFLGLDNIGVFDRSGELPTGGHVEQADGTSWMAMFSLNMMRIALELASTNSVYEDLATKFFEHFLYITAAMNNLGGHGIALWDEEDEFFYDTLHCPDGSLVPLKIRSMVGLIPLFAIEVLEPELLNRLPNFRRRLEWFFAYRPDLAALVSRWDEPGRGRRRMLSLLRAHRMKRVLARLLDPVEFLSDFGVRSMSLFHRDRPYEIEAAGTRFKVDYQPAESTSAMFGGNSNWRGPIWFPVNALIIESLRKFHTYYTDDFVVECPTRSGRFVSLAAVADELQARLSAIFRRDSRGRRAVFGDERKLQEDEYFRDLILFNEYFHGDTGRGLGASHQTGWTGLVADMLAGGSKATTRPIDVED
jgi:hypothetical protein